MKKYLSLLTIFLLFLISCQVPIKNTDTTAPPAASETELKYDDGTLFLYAPSGDPNVEYGIRFPYYNIIIQNVGKRIMAAEVYLRVVPTSVNVKIYACDFNPSFPSTTPDTEPNGGYPGFGDSILFVNQLYNSGNYTFTASAWNRFNLTNVVTIPSLKDIWVVIEITDTVNNAQISFDGSSGHFDSNYYRLTVGTGSWLNYLSLTNSNMLIRAVVE
jgi:hypothetical protein